MRWLFWQRRHFVEVQRTFVARPRTVWSHLLAGGWLDGEAKWQVGVSFHLWDGTRIKVRTLRAPHELMFDWIPAVGDRSQVKATVALHPKGTLLTFRQEGISKDDDRSRLQGRWEKALDSIAESVHHKTPGTKRRA